MPNIKSAKKRVKVIKVKTLQNKMHTTALKTEIKKFDAIRQRLTESSIRTPRLTRRASSPKRSTLWRKMRTEGCIRPWGEGDPLS